MTYNRPNNNLSIAPTSRPSLLLSSVHHHTVTHIVKGVYIRPLVKCVKCVDMRVMCVSVCKVYAWVWYVGRYACVGVLSG